MEDVWRSQQAQHRRSAVLDAAAHRRHPRRARHHPPGRHRGRAAAGPPSLKTLLAIIGPGLIVMVGDNDAGAFATYGQAGQNYGTRLLWTLLLLVPVLYVNQEMVLRLGAVTGVGHARLILERFGKFWGAFSVIDLFILNALTIVTEFIGITLAAGYLGLPKIVAVALAAAGDRRVGVHRQLPPVRADRRGVLRRLACCSSRSTSWLTRRAAQMAHDFVMPGCPAAAGQLSTVMLLVIGIVGTTVAPWQLFFQQSYVIDKRITPRFMKYEKADLWIGIVIVVVGAAALMGVDHRGVRGHAGVGHFTDAAGLARGLQAYAGRMAGRAVRDRAAGRLDHRRVRRLAVDRLRDRRRVRPQALAAPRRQAAPRASMPSTPASSRSAAADRAHPRLPARPADRGRAGAGRACCCRARRCSCCCCATTRRSSARGSTGARPTLFTCRGGGRAGHAVGGADRLGAVPGTSPPGRSSTIVIGCGRRSGARRRVRAGPAAAPGSAAAAPVDRAGRDSWRMPPLDAAATARRCPPGRKIGMQRPAGGVSPRQAPARWPANLTNPH